MVATIFDKLRHASALLILLALLGVGQRAVGLSGLALLIAQPTTYTSPSGVYSLFVDPSERMGRSSATYRFSKNGEKVWSAEREYTLRAVTVTDKGCVVGIAYRDVPQERDGEPWDPIQYFHVIILDRSGREILNDVSERPEGAHFNPPQPNVPYAVQLLVDPDNDRVVLRLVEDEMFGRDGWWVYRLSTGELLDRFWPKERMPDPGDARFVLDSRLIPGTPLILVHWYTKGPDREVEDAGARFTVVDTAGHPVWTLDVPNDYADLDLHKGVLWGAGPRDYFQEHPAILTTNERRRFDLRLFSENKQAKFELKKKGQDQWLVSEIDRKKYVAPEATETQMESRGTLRYLGKLELGGANEVSDPFGMVRRFTFDKDGNIYVLQFHRNSENTTLVVNQAGRIVGQRAIGRLGANFHIHWTDTPRLRDNHFVVLRKDAEDGEYAAWVVDLTTGEQTPFEAWPGGYAKSVSRFADGGFVVLDRYSRTYSPADRLSCYDADGTLLWQKRSDNLDDREILETAPRDVAVTTAQRVVLLNKSAVHLLDRQGEHLKRVDLIGVFQTGDLGGTPRYLHEVVADEDGGFVIKDSTTPPTVVRFDADGNIRTRWSPRHPDGQTFDIPGVWVAPDGRLWTSDGRSLLRLTDEGVVDLVLGETAKPERLERIVGFTVDFQARLYAVAHGTGAVHVFDRSSGLHHLCEPDPTDMPGTVREAFVAVTDLGEVYVQRLKTKRYSPPDEYLRFSPAGERMEIVTFEPRLGTATFGPGWAFQPETGYRCGFCMFKGDAKLMLVDPPDKVVREIRRRPNGKYFSHVWSFAMAPDGSMAVLSNELGGDRRQSELDLFSPNGDPIRSITLPRARRGFSTMAFDGQRAVVVGKEEALLVDAAGEQIERYALEEPPTTPRKWRAFVVGGGRELLLFDAQKHGSKDAAIHRYGLP